MISRSDMNLGKSFQIFSISFDIQSSYGVTTLNFELFRCGQLLSNYGTRFSDADIVKLYVIG
jgi:hypothetical protein